LLCPLLVEGDLALGFGLSPQWTNSHLFVLISIKKTYLKAIKLVAMPDQKHARPRDGAAFQVNFWVPPESKYLSRVPSVSLLSPKLFLEEHYQSSREDIAALELKYV
jgi:hypothetical protein